MCRLQEAYDLATSEWPHFFFMCGYSGLNKGRSGTADTLNYGRNQQADFWCCHTIIAPTQLYN